MVFVLDKTKTSLAPTTKAKARILLKKGKAVVHKMFPLCRMDRFGFPRTKAKGPKIVKGFQTGDIAKAIVTKVKKIGTYLGKVAVRVSGNFNITTNTGTIQGINHKYCKTIQKGYGYAYSIATIKQ